ncbi:uncharacterized protein RCO7_07697 [Rhynchosporium graminicola]|uniref:Cytochrome P450 n=1 Tax=Rhynchosporium graminicola TaxID=2792576 RepID=A0A1E1LPS7_9HELO|nr:uncharacterized protein RCO7_07697 [Rhynchosporium commune]
MAVSSVLHDNWGKLSFGLLGLYILSFVYKFIKHRRLYSKLPTPPHSMLWGNLKTMTEAKKRYPADAHPQIMFTEMAFENKLKGLFYVDLYPFAEPMLFMTDPAVSLQTQTTTNFVRHPLVKASLGPIVGSNSVFSSEGAEWARQRKWFTPAFSMSHMLSLIPSMIEETMVFCDKLTQNAASGTVFSMNDATTKLAIDFIGRTVGDIRLKSQTGHSSVLSSFSSATSWTASFSSPLWKRILSKIMMRYHTRNLDNELRNVIREKYRQKKDDGIDKSILDLALKGYRKEHGSTVRAHQDERFLDMALNNAKTFFLAGHDTTASLMTYMFYYLSINPDFLARVRQEHDSVFGTSLEATVNSLGKNPSLVNQLSLTSALIKEVLRLHPAGFTIRKGTPGATLEYDGRKYPADTQIVCNLAAAMHYDSHTWQRPHEFDPDRFLQPETHSMDSWQIFGKGLRSCIGQQLVTIEARVLAAMTVRFFTFEAVFKEHGLNIPGFGGRAYQQVILSAKPKVRWASNASLRER